MRNRGVGLILIILGIVIAFILISFTAQLQEQSLNQCICTQEGGTCAHQQGLPWQSFIGFLFVIILIIFGIYIFRKKEIKEKRKITKKDLGLLDKDEKKIYKLITDADGTIFQSELVDKSGFAKVKVTRILDKLEGKNIVTRRRRGMTNVVILN
ncbi:MAG: hypothetical protein JSW08_02325 [archaeon]|nr:MAG: hypothetical protein JSW08_02325 [archaeon]